MLDLLDANVLILAKSTYYEFGRVDQYWEWLLRQADEGNVKLPLEIYEEITQGSDELRDWVIQYRDDLILEENINNELLQIVISEGYGPNLTEGNLETMGKDPYLIAYAMVNRTQRTVVTGEKKTNRQRQNRKIPNVCEDLGSRCIDQFQFGKELDFRISH